MRHFTHNTLGLTSRLRTVLTPLAPVLLAAALLTAVCTPSACSQAREAAADSTATPGLDELLSGYNTNIEHAMAAIEKLSVRQEMVEPEDDGGERRALAVLTYDREGGMEREELSSDLGHPTGEYTLRSLVGPEILADEYDAVLAGVEEMDGRICYRVSVTALERDRDHFDGDVWIEVGSLGLVRIVGEVADPPFPVQRVRLDKAFEPVPEGFRLLRRHTGEVDIKLALISRHGLMHIFYLDYAVTSSR
jgi:hypothetical protein